MKQQSNLILWTLIVLLTLVILPATDAAKKHKKQTVPQLYCSSGEITQLVPDETDWEWGYKDYYVFVPEDNWNNGAIIVGPLFPSGIKVLWNPDYPNFKTKLIELLETLSP